MELRTENVQVETSEYRIVGTMTFPAVHRLSDALNNRERDFLSLTDVTIESKRDGTRESHSYMAVGRSQIIVAISLDAEGSRALGDILDRATTS